MTRPFCVGLTGGVGSGKSTISRQFADLGVEVIDTDVIGRQLTAAGGAALPHIRSRFGPESLLADGSLDRRRLRQTVFAEPEARRDLERILHPLILAAVRDRLAQAAGPYVILVVPLLVESGSYAHLVDRVLVVDCSETVQVQRVIGRDGISASEARAMLAAQVTRAERLAHADDVIDNTGELTALSAEVKRLHRRYVDLATVGPASIA